MPPHIETHNHCDNRAVLEFKCAGEVGRDFDRDTQTLHGLTRCDTFFKGFRCDRRNTFDGTEDIDERSHIIRSHIEHRTAADVVVESGVRMPAFVSVSTHERRSSDRSADFPRVQCLPRGLDTRAEKGVGCRSDTELFYSGGVNELLSAFGIHTEGFFAVDVFARFQDLQTDFDVGSRDREVHDEFDLVICEQFIDGAYVGIVFFGLCLRRFHSKVSTGFDF